VHTNERLYSLERVRLEGLVLLCCGGVRGYTHTHISFDLGDCGVLYRARRGARIHATRFVFVNTFDSYIDELLSNSFIYTLDSGFVF
jgi:hypothetical protein